ncbi:MAG: polyprenyl diphosphate synthase [Rikenellaceae bacterium]
MSRDKKNPRSVAIIMDGNGRWAQLRGLDRVEGHIRGVESVREAIKSALRCGVEVLTIYAFSTENWGRPSAEVDALMDLMGRCIIKEVPELVAQGVKMSFIGDVSRLSQDLQLKIEEAERECADCSRLTFQIAMNYSSRDEIRRAVCSIAERVKASELEISEISEQMISDALDTSGVSDPDLIIRTSGEMRLSNFMMWQASYSEFYFPEVLWPDFGAEHFDEAMEEYARRNRRFGLVIDDNEEN